MSKHIAIIPGDGIGKEVIPWGIQLLRQMLDKQGTKEDQDWKLHVLDLGADRFLKDGSTFGAPEKATCESSDAILLGALGDPRVPSLDYARDILFGLRFGMDLYCNVRPIECLDESLMPLKLFKAEDCKMIVFRENTEGIYVGIGGQFKKGTPDEIAINEDLNTRKGVERIIRAAFEYAKTHGHKKVHMADKSNAMKHAHELWGRVFAIVAREYPGIQAQHAYVDALCYQMIKNPKTYEVIVTNNLFGDIVTDLGAALQGGLGMAGSANINPVTGKALFEPVHGSAPDIVGKNIANPIATFLSVGMMLSHLGYKGEADIKAAVKQCLSKRVLTPDLGGTASTEEVAKHILAQF